MSARPVLSTLRHIWLTLESTNVRMAVMGGMALAVWERIRSTQDVDLLVACPSSELDAMLEKLAAARFRPKRQPPILTLGRLRIVQLLYEPPQTFLEIQVDLLLAESRYHLEAVARRVPAQLADLDIGVAVLTCEDMILHKLIAGRLIDRADAAALLQANRNSLDLGYLRHWTDKLKLGADLAEVWREAFAGETPPHTIG